MENGIEILTSNARNDDLREDTQFNVISVEDITTDHKFRERSPQI